MDTKYKILRTLIATSLFGGALMGTSANAAPVSYTVSGTVFAADGSEAAMQNNAYTASFVIDSDAMAATGKQLTPSADPNDPYTSWYSFGGFGGSSYGASFSSLGFSYVSSYGAEVRVTDDLAISGWPINIADGTYDVIEITGGLVTNSYCPLQQGCQGGEEETLDGVEFGWVIVMDSAWQTGGALPSALPNSLDPKFVAQALWVTSQSAGIETGNALASVNNVTVSSVPEPEAWGLMLSGLALVGAAARRKRSVRQ